MLLSRLVLLLLAVPGLQSRGSLVASQFLEVWHGGEREETLEVTPLRPAELCVPDHLKPSAWSRPFTQVTLRLEHDAPQAVTGFWPRASKAQPVLKWKVRPSLLCRILRSFVSSLCQDCSQTSCPVSPDVSGQDYTLSLPPDGGCVFVHKLPQGTSSGKVSWELTWDPTVPVRIVTGLILVWGCNWLQESAFVHGSLGGTCCLVVVSSLVLYLLLRELRGTVAGSVPFGRTALSFGAALFTIVPAAREAVLHWAFGSQRWQSWLEVRDPFYDLPLGYIITCVASLALLISFLLGAKTSIAYFASPPEPEGDVPFVIGADGSRLDILPPSPLQQRLLGWSFWLAGLGLLLTSTNWEPVSVVITVTALLKDWLLFLSSMAYVRATAQPRDFRHLISLKDFDEQGRDYTAAALDQLRGELQDKPHLLNMFRDSSVKDSELRLRRFYSGGAHVQPPDEGLEEGKCCRCTLM